MKEFTKIVTFSGRAIDPLNPKPDDICIEDIAHALSMTCRFSGHTNKFFSVARHCMNVAVMVPEDYLLYGLLHDAPEAYLTDIPKPFKDRIPGYTKIEDNLLRIILKKFGLSYPLPEIVKLCDKDILEYEQFKYMPDTEYWPHTIDKNDMDVFMHECPVGWISEPLLDEEIYLELFNDNT